MSERTALYDLHLAAQARLIDFGGYDMPIHYGSQLDEHHAVRRAAGMFDVSHMTVLDLAGARQSEFLRHLLANDVARLATPGRALYSCMLNETGGVLDDLIVYFLGEGRYRVVVNAATRAKDIDWMRTQAVPFGVEISHRADLSMIAVQGPQARDRVLELLDIDLRAAAETLRPFHAAQRADWFIGRTGYTGEDGFELILPHAAAQTLWRQLQAAGVQPCGLGARDTLRLEAGLNLYGSDMDETTTPLESNLAWTINFDAAERDFIGRRALEAQRRAGVPRRLVGLMLEDKGVLRGHQPVRLAAGGTGITTSGSYAPTLQRSIALARIPAGDDASCEVSLRGRWVPARIVPPPFVRQGKPCHDADAGTG